MEIHPEDYTEYTKKLTVGQTRKVPHKECSNSNVLRIENSIEGLKFYCFKCRDYTFESSFNSPRERARRQESFDAYREAKAKVNYDLPLDFSHTIPSKALAWLGQGGWTIGMIRCYNIGYSEKLHRVVIPVGNSGYIARAVESWQSPKYLEKVPKGAMWESCIELANKVATDGETNNPMSCVVCEDILSAGRCGEYIKAYALLGTSLDTTQLSVLMKYQKIFLWLDPDKGGRQGVKQAVNRLRMFSEVQIVNSPVDPKKLTNEQIKEYLR